MSWEFRALPAGREAFLDGVTTGIRYIDAFAELAAYEAEVATLAGKDSETRSRIVRSPSDVNIQIDPALERLYHQPQAQDRPAWAIVHHCEEPDSRLRDHERRINQFKCQKAGWRGCGRACEKRNGSWPWDRLHSGLDDQEAW